MTTFPRAFLSVVGGVVLMAGVVWSVVWLRALDFRIQELTHRVNDIDARCPPMVISNGSDRYAPCAISWLCADLNARLAVQSVGNDGSIWVRCSPVDTNVIEVQVHQTAGADKEMVLASARVERDWVEHHVRSLGWSSWLRVTDKIIRSR